MKCLKYAGADAVAQAGARIASVIRDPVHERQQALTECMPALGEAVVDARGDGRLSLAMHEPVGLEGA